MTVIGPAPPARELRKRFDAYYVTLNPDPSRNLKVIVQLYLEFADASGELNAAFFEPVSRPIDTAPEEAGCTEPEPQARSQNRAKHGVKSMGSVPPNGHEFISNHAGPQNKPS